MDEVTEQENLLKLAVALAKKEIKFTFDTCLIGPDDLIRNSQCFLEFQDYLKHYVIDDVKSQRCDVTCIA